jgi:hypothetical protein
MISILSIFMGPVSFRDGSRLAGNLTRSGRPGKGSSRVERSVALQAGNMMVPGLGLRQAENKDNKEPGGWT